MMIRPTTTTPPDLTRPQISAIFPACAALQIRVSVKSFRHQIHTQSQRSIHPQPRPRAHSSILLHRELNHHRSTAHYATVATGCPTVAGNTSPASRHVQANPIRLLYTQQRATGLTHTAAAAILRTTRYLSPCDPDGGSIRSSSGSIHSQQDRTISARSLYSWEMFAQRASHWTKSTPAYSSTHCIQLYAPPPGRGASASRRRAVLQGSRAHPQQVVVCTGLPLGNKRLEL